MRNIVRAVSIALFALPLAAKEDAACEKISPREIAQSYLSRELKGWRAPASVSAACARDIRPYDAFRGSDDETKPTVIYSDEKSLKIRKVTLLDHDLQRFAVDFSVEDTDKKIHNDRIVFEKESAGRMSARSPCSRLISAPVRAVYVSKDCKK